MRPFLQATLLIIAIVGGITLVIQAPYPALLIALVGGLGWACWHFRRYGEVEH